MRREPRPPDGRDFRRRREVVERSRSASWPISVALLVGTIGAVALGYLAVQLFYLPDTMAQARLNRVPDLIGVEVEDAEDEGRSQGYVVVTAGAQATERFDPGEVLYQVPPPDFYLPRGDTLWVLVSAGRDTLRVPDVVGLEPELAQSVLRDLGLRSTAPRRAPSDIHLQGTVIETVPPPGTPVAEGTPVTFVVSRGGSLLTMPDVRGLSLAAARDSLEMFGLGVGEVTSLESQETRTEGEVVVVAQEPRPGFRVPAGTAIRLELGEAGRVRRPAAEPGAADGPPRPPPVVPPEPDPVPEDELGEDEAF